MSLTGKRWSRPQRECPQWCAQDHQCTVWQGLPAGEHRSSPLVWRLPYGRLVATRVAGADRCGRLEVRATVRLAGEEQTARWQAQRLAVGVDLAIRGVLRLPAGPGLLHQLAGEQVGEVRR